jgi:hypothetical protein
MTGYIDREGGRFRGFYYDRDAGRDRVFGFDADSRALARRMRRRGFTKIVRIDQEVRSNG